LEIKHEERISAFDNCLTNYLLSTTQPQIVAIRRNSCNSVFFTKFPGPAP